MKFPTEQLEKLFWKSPVGRQLLDDGRQEERDTRLAAEQAIKDINAQEAKTMPKLVKARAAAEAEFTQARAALKWAEENRRKASHAVLGAQHQFHTQRALQQAILRATNGPDLVPFLDQLEAEREALKHPDAYRTERTIETVGYTIEGGRILAVRANDNMAEITATVEAITAAEARAKELACNQADFAGELEELLESIPDHLASN